MYDSMAADPYADIAPMYGQRSLYYEQAEALIGKGVHLRGEHLAGEGQ